MYRYVLETHFKRRKKNVCWTGKLTKFNTTSKKVKDKYDKHPWLLCMCNKVNGKLVNQFYLKEGKESTIKSLIEMLKDRSVMELP